jgi:hypothetical protein
MLASSSLQREDDEGRLPDDLPDTPYITTKRSLHN